MNVIQTVILASRKDEQYRERLMMHLAPFERSGVLSLWHEGMLSPGSKWAQVMAQQLEDAHLVIALISAPLLADRQQCAYLRAALLRQEQGLCITVSVLLSPCGWRHAFETVPTIILPRSQKEITLWPNKTRAFAQVGDELQVIIERISRRFLA